MKNKQQVEAGRKGGLKTKRRRGNAWFSKLAKKSHPKNNPKARRAAYNGGRKKNDGTLADQ